MAKREKGTPIDLASLDTGRISEEGARLELMHPSHNIPLGVYIILAGTDSDLHRKTLNRITNRRRKRWRPGQPMPEMTAEELFEDALELIASCTLGWEGIVVDGQLLEFSRDNARELYRRFAWIREQVDAFMADRSNFLSG